MTASPAPSLLGTGSTASSQRADAGNEARRLTDLLYDGFYLLFLLQNGHTPSDADAFAERIRHFLAEFERAAKRIDVPAGDIEHAKYAFCAAVDETILRLHVPLREAWARTPLQLKFFGDQLAGERFFTRLEELRQEGAVHLQAIEVFHLCLLLGFQGKYLLEGLEKLEYFTARLGDEIAHLKNKRAAFAPHWKLPDRITHTLKTDVPVWAAASVFGVLALGAYMTLEWQLGYHTEQTLAQYNQVVKLAPRAAHLTITLP